MSIFGPEVHNVAKTGLILAFSRLHTAVYEGTTTDATIATRRRKNKAAKIARRANR